MTSGPAAQDAVRLSRLVAALGDRAWSGDLDPLTAVPATAAGTADAPPTYGDIARAGTDLVASLSGDGRWDEAAVQARHLRRLFAATGMSLGPIAAQAFDGLLAATLARDPDELRDFVELVGEMFT